MWRVISSRPTLTLSRRGGVSEVRGSISAGCAKPVLHIRPGSVDWRRGNRRRLLPTLGRGPERALGTGQGGRAGGAGPRARAPGRWGGGGPPSDPLQISPASFNQPLRTHSWEIEHETLCEQGRKKTMFHFQNKIIWYRCLVLALVRPMEKYLWRRSY
jgi:hypothetical protein